MRQLNLTTFEAIYKPKMTQIRLGLVNKTRNELRNKSPVTIVPQFTHFRDPKTLIR